jgi:hypothetical protein
MLLLGNNQAKVVGSVEFLGLSTAPGCSWAPNQTGWGRESGRLRFRFHLPVSSMVSETLSLGPAAQALLPTPSLWVIVGPDVRKMQTLNYFRNVLCSLPTVLGSLKPGHSQVSYRWSCGSVKQSSRQLKGAVTLATTEQQSPQKDDENGCLCL